jgi:hypothetical protein
MAFRLAMLASLTSTYKNKCRWDEAEELQAEELEISKRLLESEHPGTLTSMRNLASMYRNKGWYDEMEELGWQVMETK